MTVHDVVPYLVVGGLGLLIAWNVARFFHAEMKKHQPPVMVDGHVRLFGPDRLLTEAEQRFATSLEPALPPGARLLAKCRMMELVRPVVPDHHRFHEAAKRLVLAKDVDFVVTSPDWRVLFAVELDDRSHVREDRRQRDRIVEAVFREAGVPLLRIRTNEDWSTPRLRRRIDRLLAEASAPRHLTDIPGSADSNRRRSAGRAPG